MKLSKKAKKVYDNWHEYAGVKEEDFIAECEWLKADPLNEQGRMTRELGCTRKGELVRLIRANDVNGNFVGFYREPKEPFGLGRLWEGRASISSRDI